MNRRLWPLLASLLLSLVVAACGDEDSPSGPVGPASPVNDDTPSATLGDDTPQPGSTATVPDATVEPEATPAEFETLRDKLRGRLDAIGASIGDAPNDIREQLLASCRELGDFVDADRVEPICQDIEDAMERGDPGKIDLVLDHLANLETD